MQVIVPLSGGWLLATDPGNTGKAQGWAQQPASDAQPAPVPGIIQQVYPDYHGVAWYWRRFAAPDEPRPHRRWQIHFHGGVDYFAEAWLNGHYLGCAEGGEAPFDLDAGAALTPAAENLLAVRVVNPTHEPIDGFLLREVPHRNKAMPYVAGSTFNFGGITQPVELRSVPDVRIVDLWVRPDPRTGKVLIEVTFCNDAPEMARGRLSATIGPALAQGPAILAARETRLALAPGPSTAEIELQLAAPRLWQLADPYLYRVAVRLQAELPAAALDDEYAVRCGFRDLRVERGFFRLNGRRLFIRSTHTINEFPQGQITPVDPDLLRRDLIMAKAAGFNMVRFICGMALPAQLDICDELGLLVYEENMASWCLADSPHMAERFDHNTDAMIRRDRHHPSVVVWGLLNETRDGPVFRHAVDYLPRLRRLDPTRLVLLASGRWDCQWHIGSVSNPGSRAWEHQWGAEAPDAAPAVFDGIWKADRGPGAYFVGAGDAHAYPWTPQTPATDHFLRTLGRDTRPVYLSEYGIGSLFNVLRELRCFEQAGARPDLFDVATVRGWAEQFVADWQRWGFDGVYAFPADMLEDSQRRHARQRTLGFDLIRSNPQLCGYNLTGMLDHVMAGEGAWTLHREWKPGIVDALADGWSAVRWCLFCDPLHGYRGRPLLLEAVLANEDVLQPGSYPVTYRITGEEGLVWEQQDALVLPAPAPGCDAPLAVPALTAELRLDLPAGAYQFAAYMQHGGAPAGGRLKFHVSDPAALPRLAMPVTLWGIAPTAAAWLVAHGSELHQFNAGQAAGAPGEVLLVGLPDEGERSEEQWAELARRVTGGATAICLQPAAFACGDAPLGRLPLKPTGGFFELHDWLYHKECVARNHPLFAGLPAGGILDWDYYGPVIPHGMYHGQATPDEVVAAAFAVSYPNREGYVSGVLLGVYRCGAGRLVLNTFPLLEQLDRHPVADRLLVNLINYAYGAEQP